MVAALYLEGKPLLVIAEQFGCTISAISVLARRRGFTRRTSRAANAGIIYGKAKWLCAKERRERAEMCQRIAAQKDADASSE